MALSPKMRAVTNLAKADRARSSLPFVVTLHAYERLQIRFPEVDARAFREALPGARRLAEDGGRNGPAAERWLVEVGEARVVAVAFIEEEAGERRVVTVQYLQRPQRFLPPDVRREPSAA